METRTAPSSPREGLGRLGVKLYRYKGLLLRKWWIVALTIAMGLAYQGWILSQMPRLFESMGKLLIGDELSIAANITRVNGTDNFVGTNLSMLKSNDVLERARQRVAIEHPELARLVGSIPTVNSTVEPRTQIFNVSAAGENPEYTQKFVDALIDAFIERRKENRQGVLSDVMGSLQSQITLKQGELQTAQEKLDAYVKANNMAFWTKQAASSTEFLSGLKTRQAILETELKKYRDISPDKLLVIPPTPSMSSAGDPNGMHDNGVSNSLNANLYPLYLSQSQELSVAQSRLEDRSRVWKDKHPKLILLKEDVAKIQRSLELIRQQNREATAQRIDAIKAELLSLEDSIKDWDAKVAEASIKDTEYRSLSDTVTRINENIASARKENEAVKAPPVEAFQKLQPATEPYEIDKGVKKHLMMGVISGFIAGFLILVLLDRADDRMTSSSEILDQFSEPILGQIPNVDESRDKAGLPLLQPDDERYSYAEAFRSLRSSLIFMPNQTELRTILVTSAIPNEGKSTITSNLAITMAAAGANVVVVDADLRRGDLASLFDTDGRTGLSNVLRGEVPWQSAVQETRYPNLTLIPRGPVTNQSSELLLLPTLQKLLDGLKDNYDLIIFNTAPILATDDTPSLSPSFDGTVMVMRAQFTSARLTQNSLNALYQRQVNVLGLVLNCVDTQMPDYYYYRYPKYYAAAS